MINDISRTPDYPIVYQFNDLQVKTDIYPIGGFRGKAGALQIEHIQNKTLTEFNSSELELLAQVIQKILGIYNQANIQNVLIFAKHENSQLKFTMTPYPKCNWIEKIQGFVNVIFGEEKLSQNQTQEITDFFKDKFAENIAESDLPYIPLKKPDVFCNPNIIQKQLITDITKDGKTYHLLHDNAPKGRTSQDPHFLIVPHMHDGHTNKIDELAKQRFHMLTIAQQAIQVLMNEGHETVLFIERNGSKLQGVQHKNSHVTGIKQFPKTFLEKCTAFLRLMRPAVLSKESLQEKILHYKSYQWI